MEEEEQKTEEIQNTSFKGGWQIEKLLDDVWNTPSVFKTGKDMVTGYIDTRQQLIDNTAQFTDKVVTSGLQKINMPGAEFIGDRARNIAGFTTDLVTPEVWELPLYGATMAEPTPFGEGAVYGIGLSTRLAKAQLKAHAALMKNAPKMLDWAFSSSNSIFNKVNPNWRLATPDGGSIDGSIMKSTSSGTGGNWTLSQGLNPIKNQVLVSQLDTPKIENWLTGKTRTISKKNANLIQELATSEDFMSIMTPKFDALKKKYPTLVKQIGEKETLLIRWHHVNPSKGGVDLYKGLTKANDRMELNRYLIDELGIYSGNHPLNNRGLSIDVHDQIHSWLGQRVGLRADALKYKWAQKLGINVGQLSPGKGFMADHLVLSKQGNQAWDNFFSKLTVEQRKPFFKEYGQLIKESDKVLDDLMRQYDALYAMPDGFRAVIPDQVLLEFLESIPMDGSKLLQKDMRQIVEQVAAEMPRGTLDIINEAGDVRRLDLESKVYKRLQEAKIELDEKGLSRRKINSLKSEIKDLEQGIYQEAIDFKGVEKQGAWQRRLQQEKLRREGKK